MQPKKNSAFVGIIAIVLITAAVVGTIVLKPKSDNGSEESNTPTTSTSTTPSESTSTPSATSGFKNGTYSATGSYTSPGGNEEIDVTVTLTDNKVTEVSVAPQAATRESMSYQDEFVSEYKDKVVGKDITSLKLSKVSGSSLTSRGFNEAIDKIKSQAQS